MKISSNGLVVKAITERDIKNGILTFSNDVTKIAKAACIEQ